MSAKNSKMDHDHNCAPKVHASSLRSKTCTEEERARKLVKFNNIAEVKELSGDSADSKLNVMTGNQMKVSPSTSATSTLVSDKDVKPAFRSKRRNHYKDEFTNSKTSKNSDHSD